MTRKTEKQGNRQGDRACRFIENLVLEQDGIRRPFKLRPWQREIVNRLFGTVRADGLRQYKKLFLALPRGQGKTTLIAALALYCLLCEGRGNHLYSASGDKEQAALIFDAAVAIIQADPYLSSIIEVYTGKKRLVYPAGDSSYQALSSESDAPHGKKPSHVFFDEVHVFPNRRLHDALVTGMGKRKERMVVYITTAGYDKKSFCYELWQHARSVLEGHKVDATLLVYLFAASPEDPWESEATWYKAMPALGDFYSLEFIRDEFTNAKTFPYYENVFKNYYLNLWTEQQTAWLPIEQWDSLEATIDPEVLRGRTCFAALDLSSTTDLTALCLVFELADKSFYVLPYFFVPQDSAEKRSKRDKVPYPQWIKDGVVIGTEGNVTDYEAIRKKIDELSDLYRFEKLGVDPWNAQQLANQLVADGQDVVEYRQVFANLSPPSKELERLILSGKIHHDGNPCMRWNISNCAIEQDASGAIRPSKKRSNERIDGVLGVVMALGLATSTPTEREASMTLF